MHALRNRNSSLVGDHHLRTEFQDETICLYLFICNVGGLSESDSEMGYRLFSFCGDRNGNCIEFSMPERWQCLDPFWTMQIRDRSPFCNNPLSFSPITIFIFFFQICVINSFQWNLNLHICLIEYLFEIIFLKFFLSFQR